MSVLTSTLSLLKGLPESCGFRGVARRPCRRSPTPHPKSPSAPRQRGRRPQPYSPQKLPPPAPDGCWGVGRKNAPGGALGGPALTAQSPPPPSGKRGPRARAWLGPGGGRAGNRNAHVCVCVHECVHVCVCAHAHVFICVCIVCVCECECAHCVSVRVCACMRVCT